ncbi:CLUMA_CG011348, isoform A, partial [Clunio marinus]
NTENVKRPDRIVRYKPVVAQSGAVAGQEDLMPDYLNILGMIFSMLGLMMKLKYCAWIALYCSCISFANSRVTEDAKQVLSSFMLSVSAVVMSYLQNPSPISASWS